MVAGSHRQPRERRCATFAGTQAERQANGINDSTIRDLGLAAMARGIRSDELSPVELVD